ncbi:MAG: phytanoyl-CoA dioxygenase family protein, partial [Microthrixaceae bacterium]
MTDRAVADVERVGVAAVSGVLDPARLDDLRQKVDAAVAADALWLPEDRRATEYGRVLFLPHHDPSFLDLLGDPAITGVCDRVLGEDCTLYTMTTSCSPPGGQGRPLHLDLRHVTPGYVLAMGVMILLDDFDEQSGSTRYLPGVLESAPDPTTFERDSIRLVAPAGSVSWSDGRLWHDATANHTDRWRRCIILAMVRPFHRQRFDIARMLPSVDLATLGEPIQRKLGLGML